MAFLIKKYHGAAPEGFNPIDQYIRVSKPDATNPQTTTRNIFNIRGGRVLVKLLIGQIGTVQGATASNTSITFTPLGGSVADLASALATENGAAGTFLIAEGDGTALLETATVGFTTVGAGPAMGFVIGPGTLAWVTSGSNTGSVKWDLYYLPLDPGASVEVA